MKYAALTILTSLTVLLSGCARIETGSYCDIAGPIYFGDEASLHWLMENDRQLVEEIVINNEAYAELCN